MKNVTYFLILLISVTFVFYDSNVFAGYGEQKTEVVSQNSEYELTKEAKSPSESQNIFMAKNACNPCAVNPCAAKKASNPCAAKTEVTPIRSERFSDLKEAIRYGEKLWKDTKLGTSDLSCDTCHAGGNTYNKTALQAYPHFVGMPNDVVTLDQMINFCMINPLKGDPLPSNSKEMTAISAYFQNVSLKEIEKTLGSKVTNPCGAKNACNPCAIKNPCNPCGGR